MGTSTKRGGFRATEQLEYPSILSLNLHAILACDFLKFDIWRVYLL